MFIGLISAIMGTKISGITVVIIHSRTCPKRNLPVFHDKSEHLNDKSFGIFRKYCEKPWW